MQHRGRNRIRTEGKSAYRVVVQLSGEFQHHAADNRCRNAVERNSAKIDVIVRLTSTRQGHLAVNNGLIDDLLAKEVTIF